MPVFSDSSACQLLGNLGSGSCVRAVRVRGDFIGKRLVELNYKVLTSLLERYPDLQCRYLGMKKYKTKDVVDFFFMQYIERLKTDDDALTILEQLNQQNK